MLLLAFAILAFIKSENTKNTFTFCNYQQNPKTTFFHNISLISNFRLFCYLLVAIYFV
jgi:hypothetical protein